MDRLSMKMAPADAVTLLILRIDTLRMLCRNSDNRYLRYLREPANSLTLSIVLQPAEAGSNQVHKHRKIEARSIAKLDFAHKNRPRETL